MLYYPDNNNISYSRSDIISKIHQVKQITDAVYGIHVIGNETRTVNTPSIKIFIIIIEFVTSRKEKNKYVEYPTAVGNSSTSKREYFLIRFNGNAYTTSPKNRIKLSSAGIVYSVDEKHKPVRMREI